jgi:hypothetical protein
MYCGVIIDLRSTQEKKKVNFRLLMAAERVMFDLCLSRGSLVL